MKIIIINCPEIIEDGIKYRHAFDAIESDRTLCGIAFEGYGNKKSKPPTQKNGTINCPVCIKIIKFCKRIKSTAVQSMEGK